MIHGVYALSRYLISSVLSLAWIETFPTAVACRSTMNSVLYSSALRYQKYFLIHVSSLFSRCGRVSYSTRMFCASALDRIHVEAVNRKKDAPPPPVAEAAKALKVIGLLSRWLGY